MTTAQWIVTLSLLYTGIGLLFALFFVTVGVARIDRAAKAGPIGFRLLILPAAAALWPWLLWRVLLSGSVGEESAA